MRTTSTRAAHARRRPRYLIRVAAVAAGALAVAGVGLQSANAAVSMTAVFPTPTTVGSTDQITLTINGAQNDQIFGVDILPSCGGTFSVPLGAANGCSQPDPGVFSLAIANENCDGTLTLNPPTDKGMWLINIVPPENDNANAFSCVITLNRTALKLPTIDHDGNAGNGIQTAAMASVLGTGGEANSPAVPLIRVDPNPNPNNGGGGDNGTCNGLKVTVPGGSGNDTINGTDGDDVISGGSGNDVINTGLGNDVVCAGSGNDTINGDIGGGTVFGNSGNDILNRNGGSYTFDGGSGNDEDNL